MQKHCLSLPNLPTVKPVDHLRLPRLSPRIQLSPISSSLDIIPNEVFPDWLLKRQDFQHILNSHTDIGYGYLAKVCEKYHCMRDVVEQNTLIAWLQSLEFSADKDLNFLQEISKKLTTRYFTQGESIFVGDQRDNVYFLLNGQVIINSDTENTMIKGPKSVISASDLQSSSTCVAGKNAVALTLKSSNISDLLQDQRNATKKLIFDFIKPLPFFKPILYNKLEQLSEHFQLASYLDGEIICEIGSSTNKVYLVKSGQVDIINYVTVKEKQHLPIRKTFVRTKLFEHQIRTCNVGEVFGYQEDLCGEGRAGKAVSRGKSTQCLIIDCCWFCSILDEREVEVIKAYFGPKVDNKELRRRITQEITGRHLQVKAIFDATKLTPMAGFFTDRKVHKRVTWANQMMARYRIIAKSNLISENHELL